MSALLSPSAAYCAICSSCGVSWSAPDAPRGAPVSPDGPQLALGPCRPGSGTHPVEDLEGETKMLRARTRCRSRRRASPRSSWMRARSSGRVSSSSWTSASSRWAIASAPGGQQPAAPSQSGVRDREPTRAGPCLQPLERGPAGIRIATADGSLHEVRSRPAQDPGVSLAWPMPPTAARTRPRPVFQPPARAVRRPTGRRADHPKAPVGRHLVRPGGFCTTLSVLAAIRVDGGEAWTTRPRHPDRGRSAAVVPRVHEPRRRGGARGAARCRRAGRASG